MVHAQRTHLLDKKVLKTSKKRSNDIQTYWRCISIVVMAGKTTISKYRFKLSTTKASPTVREIRDEYLRLAHHPLQTLVAKVKKFCDSVPDQRCLILMTTINAQSLVAHSEDISIDSITDLSCYLTISETWMEDSMAVNVPGFDLRTYFNTAKRRQFPTTSSVAVSSSSSR
ncbi:hypothetical protein TNCV_852961 [Trichonephila clavipes]|nr:hypothetical protein TNCV_852961 [Trichonephila clavipes]